MKPHAKNREIREEYSDDGQDARPTKGEKTSPR